MSRRTFFILCLEGAVLSFNVAASSALIPAIASSFGISAFIAGRLTWFYMLPYGLAALAYGPLVRTFDAKKVEFAALAFFSFANLAAACAPSIGLLFAARIFTGLFGASVIPLGLIIISRYAAKESRGRLVGIFFGSTFCASLAGLLLSAWLPWRYLFLIPGVSGLCVCVLIRRYLPSFKQEAKIFSFDYVSAFSKARIRRVFCYIFLVSLLYHCLQPWLSVYFAARYRMTQFQISMLITLTAASGIAGELIGGYLADKRGRIWAVSIGTFLMCAGVISLSVRLPLAGLALVMVAWGLGWTINHAAVSTVLTDLPADVVNEAASLNSSIRFVSGGIGTVVGGSLLQRSFPAGLATLGVCLGIFLVATRQLLGRQSHADRT